MCSIESTSKHCFSISFSNPRGGCNTITIKGTNTFFFALQYNQPNPTSIMIIENINSQTWPQTKFVIIISIFQVLVAILFCIFVRYDASIDPKFAESHSSTEYDPYPCKLDIQIITKEYLYYFI